MLSFGTRLVFTCTLLSHSRQVKMQEQDTSFLAADYVAILDNEEKIKQELAEIAEKALH